MLFEGGVVGFRRGNIGLEQHPPVDRQPPSIESLHLVGHRDMGMEIRVAGPAVPMGEGGCDQAPYIDLTGPLRAGPGEQGVLLNKRQRVAHRRLVGPFDDGSHSRVGDRP
jgi:hypothetical protein